MSTSTPRRRRRARRAAVLVTALAAAGIVVPAVTGQQTAAAASLTPFGSCEELDTWFTAAARERVGPWGWDQGFASDGGGWLTRIFGGRDEAVAADTAGGALGAPSMGAPESARSGGAVGVGQTGTNLQEADVDEPDVVKTDGRRVVTVTGDTLRVMRVDGDQLTDLGRLPLPDQWTSELLLLGDRALVVGQREVVVPMQIPEPVPGDRPDRILPSPLPVPAPPTTVLTVVDLSNAASPSVVRTQEFEAAYLSARVSGGAVRVVLSSVPNLPFRQPEPTTSGDLETGAATAANRRVVEDALPTDWLPHTVVRDVDGRVLERTPSVECSAVSHPAEDAGLGMVTVLTLDAAAHDLAVTGSTAVAADGSLVYASADRLYVATTRGGWGMPMPVDFTERLADVVTSEPRTETQLHAFDTSSRAGTDYVASGSVPGWLLGRWAMSERDGMLRVATTVDPAGGGDPSGGVPGTEAVVTILGEQGEKLLPIGSVGGLGKGEQIRAVRWFDDLAVVVTFRQTDPLYTVDLANPAAPRVMGELKVPGYSAYLHPLGDGLLLGVGQDATDDGRTTGTQVSSFDLRDLVAPARLSTLTYPNTWSDVESDSRLFSYLPDRRLALLPLAGENGGGVVTITVAQDGSLTESGRWTQPDGGGWVQRAMPVGADAVVVLGEDSRGRTVTLLRTTTLSELDRVQLS